MEIIHQLKGSYEMIELLTNQNLIYAIKKDCDELNTVYKSCLIDAFTG
mgnify:CR=1 FL=1